MNNEFKTENQDAGTSVASEENSFFKHPNYNPPNN